jgi:hypothetical protein
MYSISWERNREKSKFIEKRFHVFIERNKSLVEKSDNIFIPNKNSIF